MLQDIKEDPISAVIGTAIYATFITALYYALLSSFSAGVIVFCIFIGAMGLIALFDYYRCSRVAAAHREKLWQDLQLRRARD